MKTFNAGLLLLDLSGYTEFMTKTSLLHARQVVTEILHCIYKSSNRHLILNKVEGDALFFYSKKYNKSELTGYCHAIHKQFHEIINELSVKHKDCRVKVCRKLDNLHIKFFIHEGEITMHKIGRFKELMGQPIIEIHRLTKNKIKEDSDIAVIDKAGQYGASYDHIGAIRYNLIHFHKTNR